MTVTLPLIRHLKEMVYVVIYMQARLRTLGLSMSRADPERSSFFPKAFVAGRGWQMIKVPHSQILSADLTATGRLLGGPSSSDPCLSPHLFCVLYSRPSISTMTIRPLLWRHHARLDEERSAVAGRGKLQCGDSVQPGEQLAHGRRCPSQRDIAQGPAGSVRQPVWCVSPC